MSDDAEAGRETSIISDEAQHRPNSKNAEPEILQLERHSSETEVKTSLYELIRTEIIRCYHCGEVYTYPCILPCLHSLCGSCIDKLQKVTAGSIEDLRETVVTCPLCHFIHDVPIGGFPCNHFLCNLVELYDAQQEEEIPCTYCQYEFEENTATFRCIQCQDNLCQNCAAAHRKTKITRGHVLAPFEQIRLGKYDLDIRKVQKVNCNTHPLQACTSYCRHCKCLYCVDCKGHNSHNSVDIGSKSQTERDLVRDMSDTINLVLPVHLEQQQSLQRISTSLEQDLEDVKKAINERGHLLHQLIDSQQTAMLEELTTFVSESTRKVYEELSSLEHVTQSFSSNLQFLDSLLLHSKPEEMLDLQTVLSNRLDAVNCYVPSRNLHQETSVKYLSAVSGEECRETVSALFGRLAVNAALHMPHQVMPHQDMPHQDMPHQDSVDKGDFPSEARIKVESCCATSSYIPPLLEEPKLCAEFDSCLSTDINNTWPTGVCISALGDIVICDRDNALIKLFSPNGIYKSSIDGEMEYKLIKPFDVASLSTGELVVTDYGTESVKVFSLAGIGRLVIKGDFEYPRGVTATKDDSIVVLDSELCRVTVHNSTDGTLIRVIKGQTPSTNLIDPYYICVTQHDQLIVTDFAEPNIKVLNLSRVEESLDLNYREYGVASHKGLLQPYGCHQDQYGITLVADNRNDKINILMPNGVFGKHLLTRKNGLWRPIALCIDISGRLVVTEGLGKIKIFQYI